MRFTIEVRHERPELLRVVAALLDALARIDEVEIRAGGLPRLYESGTRYTREPKGAEVWQDVRTCAAARAGDCEDLAAWRCAEIRAAGGAARAIPVWAGPREIHCVVMHGDGTIEDPSRLLGLTYGDRTAARLELGAVQALREIDR